MTTQDKVNFSLNMGQIVDANFEMIEGESMRGILVTLACGTKVSYEVHLNGLLDTDYLVSVNGQAWVGFNQRDPQNVLEFHAIASNLRKLMTSLEMEALEMDRETRREIAQDLFSA